MLLLILKMKKLLERFKKKEQQKAKKQKEFRVEKVLKEKGDKLYIKWIRYHNSFNSWIDKKDIV